MRSAQARPPCGKRIETSVKHREGLRKIIRLAFVPPLGLGLIMLGGRGGMSGVLCGTRGCIVRGVCRAGLTGDRARLTRAGAGLTRGQPEYSEHAGMD